MDNQGEKLSGSKDSGLNLAGQLVCRLKIWPQGLPEVTLPPESFPPIRYIYIGERRLGGRFREPISRDPQKVETSAKSHFKDNRLNCGLGGFLSPRKAFETVL